MNKNLIFLFGVCLFFNISCDIREIKTTYTGSIEIITETNGNTYSEEIYDIDLEIRGDEFKRKDEDSNSKCKGEVIWNSETVKFSSPDCSCHCDCNPLIDCRGDYILGEYDIIENNDGKLLLESNQILAVDTNNDPSFVQKKTLHIAVE